MTKLLIVVCKSVLNIFWFEIEGGPLSKLCTRAPPETLLRHSTVNPSPFYYAEGIPFIPGGGQSDGRDTAHRVGPSADRR